MSIFGVDEISMVISAVLRRSFVGEVRLLRSGVPAIRRFALTGGPSSSFKSMKANDSGSRSDASGSSSDISIISR